MHRNAEELAEIERHKYFLSEKKGHDVGWDFAEQDWEANFAPQWREDQNPHDAKAVETAAAATQAVAISVDDSPADSNLRLDPAVPGASGQWGALKRLLSRIFAKNNS